MDPLGETDLPRRNGYAVHYKLFTEEKIFLTYIIFLTRIVFQKHLFICGKNYEFENYQG